MAGVVSRHPNVARTRSVRRCIRGWSGRVGCRLQPFAGLETSSLRGAMMFNSGATPAEVNCLTDESAALCRAPDTAHEDTATAANTLCGTRVTRNQESRLPANPESP